MDLDLLFVREKALAKSIVGTFVPARKAID